MTEDQMYRAGKIIKQVYYTDEELLLAIKATELTLAYFKGRGNHWGLATTPLISDLGQLKSFARSRKLET